jgi:hypothetical protein
MRQLGQVDEERFQTYMVLVGRMGPLTRRETKLVWGLLSCFIPSPATSVPLSKPALLGLQTLIQATDAGYTTDGNLDLTQLLITAKLAAEQDSL